MKWLLGMAFCVYKFWSWEKVSNSCYPYEIPLPSLSNTKPTKFTFDFDFSAYCLYCKMESLGVPCQEIQIKIEYPILRRKKRYANLVDAEPIALMSILSSFHAGYFRISLSLCSQALLWKIMVHLHNHLPSMAFYLMWYIALAIQVSLCFLYAFKCIFYFDLVKEEFSHYIGVNYLYAPFISCLLLLQSAPLMEPHSVLYKTLFWVFVLPVLTLDTDASTVAREEEVQEEEEAIIEPNQRTSNRRKIPNRKYLNY